MLPSALAVLIEASPKANKPSRFDAHADPDLLAALEVVAATGP